MTHDEARVMVSALVDDELDAQGIEAVTAHLERCAECTTFGERIRDLETLAQTLPVEGAPAGLGARVGAGITDAPFVRSRRPRRAAAALAAALIVALVTLFGGLPLPTFKLPAAEAARALQMIKTFTMEREVTDFTAPQAPRTTVERMWFRAPGFLRIERRTGTTTEIEIQRPGERYRNLAGGEVREIGLPPDVNPVPEPLSPAIAILGRRTGPGPVVAGRPTIRVELSFDRQERRTALVDAASFVVLGAERHTIVSKQTTIAGDLVETKRTISVRYNPPIDDDLFDIPQIAPLDRRFRRGDLGSLAAPPRAVPQNMTLVTAGTGPAGRGAALFADGAFGVLVTVGGTEPDEGATQRRSATVAGRPATIVLSLFDLPRVQFEVDGHSVSVTAPLAPDQLVALASAFYRGE